MAPRKKKTVPKSGHEASEPSGDETYKAPRARAPRASSPAPAYRLRDHTQLKRPERYRGDAPEPTRPLWVHPQPAFNHELARFIPWNTLPPDHQGPIPSEMAYQEYAAEREREREQENNPDSVHANQGSDVVFRPFQKDGEPSTGPTVAHLSRKFPPQDPLRAVYTADPSIVDNTKFHPPSDQYSYRDEYNPEYDLDAPEEDIAKEQKELERRKAAYVVSPTLPLAHPRLLPLQIFILPSSFAFSRFQLSQLCRTRLEVTDILNSTFRTGLPFLTASSSL